MKTLADKLALVAVVIAAALFVALIVFLDPLATEAPRAIFR